MTKYKIEIAYDGTNYFGWQIQKNKLTIQEIIQTILKKILQEDITIYAAGRTDAMVHATEQVAHFTSTKNLDLKKTLSSLNSLLPKDIRVLKILEVSSKFHARFSAKGKIYRYHLSTLKIQDPFTRLYSYRLIDKIDLKLLKKAIFCFLGTHDFSSFANKQYQGSALNSPVKTIKRIDIIKNKDEVILEFEADGFLYKMVRNIVGALILCASKKMPIENIEKILKAKDRKLSPAPASAHALFLVKVLY
jgi:tRNA pseudouridine38-40 synthase